VKRTGFARAAWLVAAKDLRLEWRTLESLTSSLLFSLMVLVVFNFAFGSSAAREFGAERLVPGVIWIVLGFAAIVGISRSMLLEREGATLEALLLAPIDRGAVFCGKLLANLVKVTLLQWVVLPLTALFYNYDLLAVAAPMILVLFLHGLGLTVLGTLFAGVAVRVGRGETLLAILLFPAATPVFISAVKCTAAVLAGAGLGGEAGRWLLTTIGFDALYFFVALSTFEFVLEE